PAPGERYEECRAGGAADLDDRSPWLDQGDRGQEVDEYRLQLAAPLCGGGLPVQEADQPAERGETEHQTGDAEVDVELHHVADAPRGVLVELQTGHVRDEVAAAAGDRLVRPESARNERQHAIQRRLPAQIVDLAIAEARRGE